MKKCTQCQHWYDDSAFTNDIAQLTCDDCAAVDEELRLLDASSDVRTNPYCPHCKTVVVPHYIRIHHIPMCKQITDLRRVYEAARPLVAVACRQYWADECRYADKTANAKAPAYHLEIGKNISVFEEAVAATEVEDE